MNKIILFVCVAAILLALGIAFAGPGVRLGYWDYGFGLNLIRQLAMPVLGAAALASIGFVVSLFTARGLAPFALFAAVVAGAAGVVPLKMRALVEGNPFIHDITTDFENPPKIVVAATLERSNPAHYVGDELVRGAEITTAEAQKEAFPELGPVYINASVDESAEIVRGVVRSMGMEILADAPTEEGWRVEATATSLWFGFVDDFVVRLQPSGANTKVDVRSKSRVGVSDLGANASRIRSFQERLKAATS